MGKALIVGAGAIGRGYIPWELKNFELTFFDANEKLMDSLRNNGRYSSYMSFETYLEKYDVDSSRSFSKINDLVLDEFDIAFVCVGPRNVEHLPSELGNLKCPIYSLENDPITAEIMRNALRKNDIYFGVPDVITSLTASPESLEKDSNAIHTENGVLYLEDHGDIPQHLKDLTPNIHWIDSERMRCEWDAKLYLHNTPHCIAAFYGFLSGCSYVHEALADKEIALILEGVVDEVLQTLKILTNYDHTFMEEYAKKEIRRFSNPLLFDPVLRVAREPVRKLQPEGRLLGILRMAISAGVMPVNLTKGIVAALRYLEPRDKDFEIIRTLETVHINDFLNNHFRVDKSSAESLLICKAYNEYQF
jgi:mannitol-1-phosphate 5-dehydrogenase